MEITLTKLELKELQSRLEKMVSNLQEGLIGREKLIDGEGTALATLASMNGTTCLSIKPTSSSEIRAIYPPNGSEGIEARQEGVSFVYRGNIYVVLYFP